MAISSLLTNITDAIAALSLSGITIRDVDQIAPTFQGMANVLYPNPDGFISNFRLDYKTFDRGASAEVDISYNLNYRFLGTLIGDMGNMPKAYSALVDKLLVVINGIISTSDPYSGKVDMELGPVSIGAKPDPAGNMFHGADLAFKITEMQN